MRRFFSVNADFLGLVSSLTCAVHCMAVPLLASTGLMFTGHHNHFVDFTFFGLGIVFAGLSLFKDAFRSGNYGPLVIGLVGFISLYFGITAHMTLASVMGGIAIASAHIWNYKMGFKSCSL